MQDHVYKLIEIVGSSNESSDKAIENAIAKAGESLLHLDWFEVVETRGHLKEGRIAHWQVKVKIGFRLE